MLFLQLLKVTVFSEALQHNKTQLILLVQMDPNEIRDNFAIQR